MITDRSHVVDWNPTVYAVEVYAVKFNLNPKSKQWTTGDSGKFEHTDY